MPKGGKVYAAARTASAPYGLREDGTPKGKGFLGLLKTGAGDEVMSEKSIGVEIGGKETLIPAIVPTLDKNEIEFLRKHKPGDKIPRSILIKASQHARKRMAEGLSPFAD